MAHMLKNRSIPTASYAVRVPVGTNTVAPNAPVVGQTRWNTDTSRLEYYTGSVWHKVAHEGNVTIVKDSFTGDNVNSNFGPMSYSYNGGSENQVLVFLNTVFQNPGVNYTFNGNTTITFTSVPPTSASIVILHNFASTVAA